MTIVFLLLVSGLTVSSYIHSGTVYNLYTMLAAPYVVIVLANQYIASPYFGFFRISDQVLTMLLMALLAFFVGSFPLSKPKQLNGQASIEDRFRRYNMQLMVRFVLMIGLVCLVWSLWLMLANGRTVNQFEESGELLSGGPIAHLRLIALAVMPITLLYGIEKKDFRGIVGALLLLISVFFTFTKYNVICAVTAAAIYIGINQRTRTRQTLVVFIVAPVLLFVGTYVIGFTFRGVFSNVQSGFYGRHLWSYIGGSVIYDNYIFTSGVRVGVDIIAKLLTFLFALPNMFLGRIFGTTFFPHIKQPHLPISYTGERSNVTDALGYLYPSYGSTWEIVTFLMMMIVIGFVFSVIVRIMLNHSISRLNTTLAFFLTQFVLMSFFGTFYINPGPWEQLILCAIVPKLFLIREDINTRNHRSSGRIS